MFDAKALTTDDAGSNVLPDSREDWRAWVSASRTRNFVLGDPLLDWLDIHGKSKGLVKDTELPDYDKRLDFGRFIMSMGNKFEDVFMAWLDDRVGVVTMGDFRSARTLEVAERTISEMERGAEVIAQAPLRNPENRTYGQPDILIRLDVMLDLFPDTREYESKHGGLDGEVSESRQYRVLDVKFSTVGLLKAGTVQGKNEYKTQLDVYNRALGRVQGTVPPLAYLAGRAWTQTGDRGESAIERIHPVLMFGDVKKGMPLGSLTDEALSWRRRVQLEGDTWDVLPEPSEQGLFPNAGNSMDSPWHQAKVDISNQLGEMTRVSYINPGLRNDALLSGIKTLDDPTVTAAKIGVTGEKTSALVDRILTANRSATPELVLPTRIHAGESEWRSPKPVEFFVDFETVSNLNDDFSKFPNVGGRPLIFMIGCGHMEDGEWVFKQFTTKRLTDSAEAVSIDDWVSHMNAISDGRESVVYHWSQAERSTLENSYRNARDRHPDHNWPWFEWFDLYRDVFSAEPVGIKNAYGLGLKAVAKALKSHGLIDTGWGVSQVDGMGAMTAAWHCEAEAANDDKQLMDFQLMQEVGKYNEVDCRVMQEILYYIRANH